MVKVSALSHPCDDGSDVALDGLAHSLLNMYFSAFQLGLQLSLRRLVRSSVVLPLSPRVCL